MFEYEFYSYTTSFSTPKGFGPIVTPSLSLVKRWRSKEFQYPEGFWPDSDQVFENTDMVEVGIPSFSTPKGFGPIVTQNYEHYCAGVRLHCVSVPRRVLAR